MKRKAESFFLAAAALLSAAAATAQPPGSVDAPEFDLGASSGASGFDDLIEVFNTWALFISGTVGPVFTFLGIVACVFAWIFAPRAGEIIGFTLRIVIAGFGLFNAGAVMTTFLV